jgi:hypothetical protein
MSKRTKAGTKGNDWDTPVSAVAPLVPHLHGVHRFAEPCDGNGHLVRHLEAQGLRCVYRGDIKRGLDAFTEPLERYPLDAIITNPPWERRLLHPMIERFQQIAPTWLLFEADWAFTRQANPFMRHCSHIVAVGRVRWVPGTEYTGMENCAWYRFHAQHVGQGPILIPAGTEKATHVEPQDLAA